LSDTYRDAGANPACGKFNVLTFRHAKLHRSHE
jgi:hypothetical protein